MNTAFKVRGFSIRGRVVTAAGEGIQGVSITGPGIKEVVTDADGYYRLTEVSSGTLSIFLHVLIFF